MLAHLSGWSLPVTNFPFVHLVVCGPMPPQNSWTSPDVRTLHLSPQGRVRPDLVQAALRALLLRLGSGLLLEHFSHASRTPTGMLASAAVWDAVFLHVATFLEAAHTGGYLVLAAAPVHSAAWQHKQTCATLSAMHWHRGRAAALLACGASGHAQRWVWYANNAELLAAVLDSRTWHSLDALLSDVAAGGLFQPLVAGADGLFQPSVVSSGGLFQSPGQSEQLHAARMGGRTRATDERRGGGRVSGSAPFRFSPEIQQKNLTQKPIAIRHLPLCQTKWGTSLRKTCSRQRLKCPKATTAKPSKSWEAS